MSDNAFGVRRRAILGGALSAFALSAAGGPAVASEAPASRVSRERRIQNGLDISTASPLPPLTPRVDPSTPQLGGYHLIASDEFSESLDGGLFLDDYLPHWSTGATRADYDVVDGHLRLIMRKDRQEWDPAYDSGMRISSVQTYERNDLHRWTNYPGTARDVVPFRGHLQKYGHFELRARMAEGGGSHCAWWMIGANQDQPEGAGIIGRESGEVDIFEVLGKDRATGGAFSVHAWRDHFGLFPIKQSFVLPDGASFADDFHVFEFDWDARGMRMAIDGLTVASTRMTVGYPALPV